MNVVGRSLVLALYGLSSATNAQTVKGAYPGMAPLAKYLMTRDSEIALARSAAPRSVAENAEILVLTANGYQRAVTGANGFVCMVARSWSAGFGDPDFWNPRSRVPICYNALAAQSQVPETIKRTQVALAGGTASQIEHALKVGIRTGVLPIARAGSVAYMMSKATYFSRAEGHWLPHLMLYVPETDPKLWGAGLPNSPIVAHDIPDERLTVFLIPIGRWSDGSLAATGRTT